MLLNIISIVIAYLSGSIPSGLIIGKLFRGVDIRDYGSGNLGATNAVRVLGLPLGLLVAIMDILKGGIIVLLAKNGTLPLAENSMFTPQNFSLILGMFAVIGHVYPVFAKFKGGKAVATSGGIFIFYNPLLALIGMITFIIVLLLTRYVSVASTCTAFSVLIGTIFFRTDTGGFDYYLFIISILLVLFIVYRHIPNYKRLLAGTEARVGKKKDHSK